MRLEATVSFIVCVASILADKCDENLLIRSVDALARSLRYMEQHYTEVNLDGILGIRITDDQLRYLLEKSSAKLQNIPDGILMKLKYLQKKAYWTANRALLYVTNPQDSYFQTVGNVLKPGKWNLRYKSKRINRLLCIDPVPCRLDKWNGMNSDSCISELLGSRENKPCDISDRCWKLMTDSGYKGYSLTHEVLYLQIGEMHGCFPRMEELASGDITSLQESLCANVLRDAEYIEETRFPSGSRDLFMEQIGICGMYGYADFFKRTWLEAILEWQGLNDCYKNSGYWVCTDGPGDKIRRKREERILKDGCASHMTSVALIALTTEIRFCIENYVSPAV